MLKEIMRNKKMVIWLLLVFIISFLIGFTNAIKKRDRIKQEKVAVEAQHTFRKQPTEDHCKYNFKR
jgi:hypothetical protein|nr:MAG TPA: hypothetical protein [Caudoviricetes sp.]